MEKPSSTAAQGFGNAADEIALSRGKLSQMWGVRKNSITPGRFHDSLRKQAAEHAGKRAIKRREGMIEKAKELRRRDSPQKKGAIGEKLPPNALLLEKYFECLEAASSLLRTRRKMCTFSAVAKTVETMTGRRFTRKHLGQIKFIFPEVLGLELVSYKDPDTAKITRDLKVVLLPIGMEPTPEAAIGGGKQVKEKYKTMEVSRKEEFRSKLSAYVSAHDRDKEIPEAILPQHQPVPGRKNVAEGYVTTPVSPRSHQLSSTSTQLSEDDGESFEHQRHTPGDPCFKLPPDMPRNATRERTSTAQVAQLEDSRMSHFGASFRPFFSAKPEESVVASKPAKPLGFLVRSLHAAPKPTSLPDNTTVSHFSRSFKPFFSNFRTQTSEHLVEECQVASVSDAELPEIGVQEEPIQPLLTRSLVESLSTSHCSLLATPDSALEKVPHCFQVSRDSPLSYPPCDSAKRRIFAADDTPPYSNISRHLNYVSPLPSTPFQPSPSVGQSQQFVGKESCSSVQPSTSYAYVKPLFTSPVRPQNAVRELRFDSPAPTKEVQACEAQFNTPRSASPLRQIEPTCSPELGQSRPPKAFPQWSLKPCELHTPSRSPDVQPFSDGLSPSGKSLKTPSSARAISQERSSLCTPCSFSPIRAHEVSPGTRSDATPEAALASKQTTPKRSRVNLGVIFDQGSEVCASYRSPSKKLHADGAEQHQIPRDGAVEEQAGLEEPNEVLLKVQSCSKPECDPDIIKCLPTKLVQTVRETERKAMEEKSRGVAELRKLAQMKADLPKMFSTLRQIFQDRSVLPHQVLLSKFLSSNGELTDAGEVEDRLKLLLQVAPDWISMTTSLTGARLYKISRSVDVVSVRKRITCSM